jgi:predicted TIM-barrel fold metal-dependent hydrolase
MTKKARPERIDRIRVVGELAPHDAEALELELRRLAKRYGVKELRIETARTERAERSP